MCNVRSILLPVDMRPLCVMINRNLIFEADDGSRFKWKEGVSECSVSYLRLNYSRDVVARGTVADGSFEQFHFTRRVG